jgi:hypothetical protein
MRNKNVFVIKICANKKIGEERRGGYPEAGINLK